MGGKDWDDVVLPGFDQPAPPAEPRKAPTHKSDVHKVGWRRHKPNSVNCDHCVTAVREGTSVSVKWASQIRLYRDDVAYLCNWHSVEQRHTDQLNGLSGTR